MFLVHQHLNRTTARPRTAAAREESVNLELTRYHRPLQTEDNVVDEVPLWVIQQEGGRVSPKRMALEGSSLRPPGAQRCPRDNGPPWVIPTARSADYELHHKRKLLIVPPTQLLPGVLHPTESPQIGLSQREGNQALHSRQSLRFVTLTINQAENIHLPDDSLAPSM